MPVPMLTPISILMSHAFDFAAALIKLVVLEHKGADEDHEDSDDKSDEPDDTATDGLGGHVLPLAARPNCVNNVSLPPIPDCVLPPSLECAPGVDAIAFSTPLAARPNRVDDASLPPIPDCASPPSFECTHGVDGIAPSSPDDVDDFVVPLPAAPDPWNDVANASPHPRTRTALDDMHAGKKLQTHSHYNQAAKHVRKIEKEGHAPRTSTLHKHTRTLHATALRVAVDAITFPAAHGAYAAKVESPNEKWGSKKPRPLKELVHMGFDVVKWNSYDTRPLVDAHGRIFAVLGMTAAFSAAMRRHQRGLFAVINIGLFYRKGQTIPSALRVDPQYTGIAERLLGSTAIQCMAAFLPLHCGHPASTNTTASTTRHSMPIYPVSPTTSNAQYFLQSAGEFDATRSRHLVLWDLKLAVELPHGALILLLSATIAHLNVPVRTKETRISFTQFTAGGLIHYVDNGFCTEGQLAQEDEAKFARMAEAKGVCWEMGLGLLSTIDELLEIIAEE
ncbi:hypothetical protein B0H17DRAFT_1135728 [Mycena rosella]|uniref:Uncharacterized protein n=1 Tax=Mycena rosella TaxID=1033263 RepID=A0AAD7DC94_MYCRO|nr:hypothetical protein B0H17DRAFT_1135728 [Mycena rosella]